MSPPPTNVRNTPLKKMQHKTNKPQHQRHEQQPRNRQTQGQHQANNVDYEKLRAVADLESEIGEVIDGKTISKTKKTKITKLSTLSGLTELANRFPDDFTSLMKTFHHQDAHHNPQAREISPMDILNLANMITQVRIIQQYFMKNVQNVIKN